MRNNKLVTPFWKAALQSLPSAVRSRYVHDIEAAERWELRLNAAVEACTHAKSALLRMFQAPRGAH
jgi:hypothetical protein